MWLLCGESCMILASTVFDWSTVHPCDRQTDRQSDRQTDGRTGNSIYAIAYMLSRAKKLFCCNMHVCYQKINWCKNVKKVMTSNVCYCFCTYCTKEHRYRPRPNYISALSCLTASCRYIQCWKQDQKYKTKTKTKTKTKNIRPRPGPRPVWDRSCHKTAVSDPKTE